MSRPTGAPRMRPTSAGKNGTVLHKNGNGMVSYEDMLVAQYLEELQKAPLRYGMTGPSPYSQKLAHSHVVPLSNMTYVDGHPRPFSAVTRPSSGKQKMDPRFIADPNQWDAMTPRLQDKKKRPVSAPVYKSRPFSATTYSSTGSRPVSAKSGSRRVRPLYKRQPHTIVVTAYKNGSRDTCARVADPNLKTLLEICTAKLELGNAARRLFLENGKEIFMAREIPKDSDIFVSAGEPFKNPNRSIKNHQEQQKNIAWTMHGLIWTSDVKKKPARTKLSKRFQSLIETSRRRVLVFRNGSGADGIEIVADPERFEEFLTSCTAKLELTSYARVLFDWEGNPITDLKEAPMLDPCLQTWSTPVLGPLWVSKGEGFSPSGVNDFLQSMITYTKVKLLEAKDYLQELKKAKDDNKDEVKIAAILSMAEPEIEEALEIVDKDIEDFTNALNRLKGQMKKLQGEVQQEEHEKSHYKLSHIEQIDAQHRLVGAKGLRLKVYENGTYEEPVILYFNLTQATRGIAHDQKKLMERLLDQCSNSHYLNKPKTNTALRPMAQKLYNKFGKEVKNVYDLKYDSEVWLSFGEPWKSPFTFVLTAVYDKVKGYKINGSNKIAREQLMIEDVAGKESGSQWEAFYGWPEDQPVREFEQDNPMDMGEMDHVMGLLETGPVPSDASFLRHKERHNLMLFGDIVMDNKKAKGSKDIWPSDAQVWIITNDGYIRSKAFPKLVLAVSGSGVACNLTNPLKEVQESSIQGTRVQGLQVWMERKNDSASNQQWFFTTDGYICAKSHPDLALTYIGMRFGDEENVVTNESDTALPGMRSYLAVCDKLEGRDARSQRWAIKQERMDNFGQWKHNKVENPEWNKKALSWPVDDKGEINEKFDWPMEGFLMPYAPPLKVEKKSVNPYVAPLRLTVLKNGVRDATKAIQVVGPDLSNMKKDNKSKSKSKTKKKEIQDNDSINEDMNVLKLEFILFLERATGMLDLPFAARRMFDADGKEHFTLHNFKRDQLVYISCGEPWSDPNLSKSEQQRRFLLANLASDVTQMRQFMALRNPQNQYQSPKIMHGHKLPPVKFPERSRSQGQSLSVTRSYTFGSRSMKSKDKTPEDPVLGFETENTTDSLQNTKGQTVSLENKNELKDQQSQNENFNDSRQDISETAQETSLNNLDSGRQNDLNVENDVLRESTINISPVKHGMRGSGKDDVELQESESKECSAEISSAAGYSYTEAAMASNEVASNAVASNAEHSQPPMESNAEDNKVTQVTLESNAEHNAEHINSESNAEYFQPKVILESDAEHSTLESNAEHPNMENNAEHTSLENNEKEHTDTEEKEDPTMKNSAQNTAIESNAERIALEINVDYTQLNPTQDFADDEKESTSYEYQSQANDEDALNDAGSSNIENNELYSTEPEEPMTVIEVTHDAKYTNATQSTKQQYLDDDETVEVFNMDDVQDTRGVPQEPDISTTNDSKLLDDVHLSEEDF